MVMISRNWAFFVFLTVIAPVGLFAQVASATAVAARTVDGAAVYYDSLHEAFEAAVGTTDLPDEITLFADVVLDEPLIVADGAHIRLVAVGADRTIRRGGGNIEFPVVWVKGDSASLTLGKPDMEYELVVDGGRFAVPPVQAHAALVVVSGPDAKLIMYDRVAIQNNYNNGSPPNTSSYNNGAGVFVHTDGDVHERQAEFIMRGGIIRGNYNDVTTYLATGGGVLNTGFGVFTMEGGVIAGNTARYNGGGFAIGSRSSFTKTGGIIYGKNDLVDLRNISLTGSMSGVVWPKIKGHAVSVTNTKPVFTFRNDTVGENETLSYAGVPRGDGVYGAGEKWDNTDNAFRRWLASVILIALSFGVGVYFVFTKIYLKRRLALIMQVAETAPAVDFEGFNLTEREKEVCSLLLTALTFRGIASALGITNSAVSFHANNLYRKLGIQSRTELFVKLGGNKEQRGMSNEKNGG